MLGYQLIPNNKCEYRTFAFLAWLLKLQWPHHAVMPVPCLSLKYFKMSGYNRQHEERHRNKNYYTNIADRLQLCRARWHFTPSYATLLIAIIYDPYISILVIWFKMQEICLKLIILNCYNVDTNNLISMKLSSIISDTYGTRSIGHPRMYRRGFPINFNW